METEGEREVHSSFESRAAFAVFDVHRSMQGGKVSIKGAAKTYEGIFNLSAQGCWDQQRLKGRDGG